MLGLASCGGDGDGGSAQAQMGTMKRMNGYFLTQDEEGVINCLGEDITVTENADGTVDGTSDFGSVMINHRGYKAENENDGAEIFGLGYAVVNPDDSIKNPGTYYLQKTSNDPIRFGGLWVGKPNMPQDGSEGMICPYVMVPDPDDVNAQEAGCPSDIDAMMGNVCYRTNAMGFVNPTPIRRGSGGQ